MDTLLENQLIRFFPDRRLADISGQWLTYINTISPPGSKPSTPLGDFISFDLAVQNLSLRARHTRTVVPGLREIVFHEAIYFLHKASHVIGCSEIHANAGAHTWSLSQAYQGSYFAAKAICYLLGGLLAENDRKSGIVIDIWPDLTGTSDLGLVTDTRVAFWFYKKRPGHVHMWQIFQHLLRVTKVDAWPREYVDALIALVPADFSQQRNILHYDGGSWIFDDLFEFVANDSYGVVKDRFINGFPYDEHSDFTFVLAQIIFRMALLLLEEIRTVTNKIEPEMELINKRLTKIYHPYYAKEFSL